MKNPVIIGSRGSDLALWQAHFVQNELQTIGIHSVIEIIKTKGDAIQHLSFDKIEGKGFFTKEIEEALLAGSIDIAVHSHKDLETTSPEGLLIAAVSERADAREMLLIHPSAFDATAPWQLKSNARVGTSSARRKSQLLYVRPDVTTVDIRGNVPTRVQKLRSGEFDAILLAKAGLDRLQLDLSGLHAIPLPVEQLVPAPAQGVLAIQTRSNDTALNETLSKLNAADVQRCIRIERTVLNRMQGGCQLPLGVHAQNHGNQFDVWVAFAQSWNQPVLQFQVSGEEENQLIDDILQRIQPS
ncbi:MAG: hydroxymethylbilane synthase [Flavobacteriales bacterium]